MSLLRRFARWIRTDYPGPRGPHIALLALFPWTEPESWGFAEDPSLVLEVIRDEDDSIWIGWRGETRGEWVRLA
jgi:hypothetical protein